MTRRRLWNHNRCQRDFDQALEDVVSAGTESDALELAESALRQIAELLRGLE